MINLDKQSAYILQYIYKHPYIPLSQLEIQFKKFYNLEEIIFSHLKPYLSFRSEPSADLDEGYEVLSPESGFIVCNQNGKIYIEALQAAKTKNIVEWTRYIITTAIALAAFIKSFFF